MKNNNFFKIVAIFIAIAWIIAPDVVVGPVDDIILMLWTASEVKKIKAIPSK